MTRVLAAWWLQEAAERKGDSAEMVRCLRSGSLGRLWKTQRTVTEVECFFAWGFRKGSLK